MQQIIKIDFMGIELSFKAIEYEESAFMDDTWRWMMEKHGCQKWGI